ncbi:MULTISPECIES: SDR family NAD(P)-dependent oxidoreductase [unclassified Nocardioides]|uniref:SDR family NAD(P)-dependent oxidoreductase n=1 Tax=unclassified Nocardioides TaxID=2615069 RepID=UPI002666B2A4|nr:SDR family oxidoreductase [Nocardioides sp. Arc9.136]WKN48508.1 SDR family NAD(P)-dependent oxidoreductase [Nocardioides sp. Arc9.136]
MSASATPAPTGALAGRTVLLTGASGGIGSATARALLAAGADVVGQYRTGRAAAEAAVAGPHRDRAHLLEGDLSGPDAARRLWADAEAVRPIDVVVVNAATMAPTPFDGTDEEWDAGWEQSLAVNVLGAGALLREAVRAFAGRGGGTAVVVSSWAAEQGSRILDVSGYAASKAAIRNLAQTLARHHARAGVRVHVVAPGVVDAGMGIADQDSEHRQAVAEGLAMGRLVSPDEVASLITYLASDACPSLSGATLDLNGASYVR